ncbi:MAG: hypothetical protein M0P71_07365 [Melioribacteraceae bacterium]|jgi:hypothetical protein|nr:hypothetical protein [Melioribacteraceae bacterium]MDD3982827.1 hypothetical protein [Candidatus Omnitrophota bacterium]
MKPIMFSKEMVEQILKGKKTQTRRQIKGIDYNGLTKIQLINKLIENYYIIDLKYKNKRETVGCFCRYNSVDNLLYVKETYAIQNNKIIYEAGQGLQTNIWQNKLFMSKKYSRIHLKISHIGIDLLNNITLEDARSEGFTDKISFLKYVAKIKNINYDGIVDSTGFLFMPVWVIKFEIDKTIYK